ncbi:MAG: glycosyltransferase family 4 protein [Roseiflexaceae bacterium]
MRILLVSTYGFDPNFPSRPEYLQARALAARGHAVVAHEYLSPRHPGQAVRHAWLDGGVAVHRSRTLGFFAPEALLRLLRADRPDIVHIHHLRNLLGFQTAAAARRLGVPVVLTPHGLLHDGDLVADRERPLEAPLRFERLITSLPQLARTIARGAHPRRAARNYLLHAPLRLIDGAAALSHHERDLLVRLGLPPERVTVLPNAVDLSGFAGPEAHRRGAEGAEGSIDKPQASSLKPQAPTVLFIGQLVARKGYDVLARAMPLVLRELPGVRFVMVSHNPKDERELRRLLAEGAAEGAVSLLGRVSEAEKIRLLRAAAVVVAPSRYEGFGIPIIEAMAAGRAIITTDVPAGNEIVRHGENGLLFPYADHSALARALVQLLRDPQQATRLGATGQREVYERYSAARLAADLEQWYTKVIAQHAS